MARKLLLASAGAGKSSQLVARALEHAQGGGKVLLLTYTINNQRELVKHICRINKYQPDNVIVKGWFSFLLEDMVRPYQRCIVPERIPGTILNSANPHLDTRKRGRPIFFAGRAEKIAGRYNPLHYVTKPDNRAHTHYLAKLAAMLHKQTGGKPAQRVSEIYSAVFIDEMQDLVGWDFSVLHALAETNITEFECVGDFRQSIYQTSETTKKPQTNAEKVAEFTGMGFDVDYLPISWRCIQSICDVADRLHTQDAYFVPTKSKVSIVPAAYSDHHGVYAVAASRIVDYLKSYNPVILRWNRLAQKQLCEGYTTYNFGEAKGLGFDRVLIIPPEKHEKFLCGDTSAFDGSKTDDSRNKLYVGITRAKYSVAFLHTSGNIIGGVKLWDQC